MFEVETDFYAGRRGYLHGGIGVTLPAGEHQLFGLTTHFVRDHSGDNVFPSFGAEFLREFDSGLELKAAAFTYFPVAQQRTWAGSLRATKHLQLNKQVTLSPFFGPTYANVRAFDEIAGAPATIHHLMLFGGIAFHGERTEATIFGSHSLFSRHPGGLATPVDLEEMTHFAAYENNDGFPRHTAGIEVTHAVTDWLKVSVRYAAILYDDQTAHALGLIPTVQLNRRLAVFTGVQFLRRQENSNELGVLGAALAF